MEARNFFFYRFECEVGDIGEAFLLNALETPSEKAVVDFDFAGGRIHHTRLLPHSHHHLPTPLSQENVLQESVCESPQFHDLLKVEERRTKKKNEKKKIFKKTFLIQIQDIHIL